MNAICIPAISPASSAGPADGPKVGSAIPGGPPMLKVGMGVGRPGSGGDGWTGTGTDDGVSRGAAAGPQAATERRNTTRCEKREAQAAVRAHQAERDGARALEQGRGADRGGDDEQDASQEG